MSGHRIGAAIANGDGWTLVENAALDGRNTFRVPARAGLLLEVRKPAALSEVFGYAGMQRQPVLVLGEGSNILFTHDWPGIVLSIATRGIRVLDDDGERVRVRVEAGENWNDLVRWTVGKGLRGLENLVLIPGTVGAAPIQNIGAYGTEVREFVVSVEAWDRHAHRLVEVDRAACAFAYRDSLFKRERERYVVTAVVFELSRSRELRIDYAGVREELAAIGASTPTAPHVAEAIARIRTRKLPDPGTVGNAGSFFKNPLVDHGHAAVLLADNPAMPAWPIGDRSKLSAAWLIEACGLKGYRDGDAGVSAQHALVLVNHGHATGPQVLAVAEHVRQAVARRFDVELEPEPRIA